MSIFDLAAVKRVIHTALEEDVGRGDLTTQLTIPPGLEGCAEVVAKQAGVLAGMPLATRIFDSLGAAGIAVTAHAGDGAAVLPGSVLASFSGKVSDLLTAERTILNFLQHLSGIATATQHYVELVAGTRARIVDTRKTLPGLRVLEKYAVRIGGGHNHRFGLDDGILIKDNHIIAAGGVGPAVARARAGAPHTIKIEVECTTLTEVDEALAADADAVLLDNMTAQQLVEAVRHIDRRALVEASGGITLESVRAVAESGVDLISVGALTHSSAALDLSMRIVSE